MAETLATLSNIFTLMFVVASMLALGLSLTIRQIVEPLTDLGLLARALLANFVLVPALAYLLRAVIPMNESYGVGLILLSTAAGAPFLPKLVQLAKGNVPFGVGLMVLLMVATVVYVPLVLPLLLPGVSVNPMDIASSLVVLMLIPLGIGLFIKARYAETAADLQPHFAQAANVGLIGQMVTMLLLNWRTLLGTPALLAAMPARQSEQTLKVATKPLEPFVIRQDDQFIGFSIDLWDAIARQLNLRYEWVDVGTVASQLDAVRSRSADVAIAGISMTTEREQRVDFSHPYFTAGLQILTTTTADSPFGSLWAFLKTSLPTLLSYLGIGLLIALGLAHVVWLVERRTNPDFQNGYAAGIWEGLWWLLTIVANGEYGDKQTRSIGKRLLTIALWLIGVILIAQFTASVTSALTVQ